MTIRETIEHYVDQGIRLAPALRLATTLHPDATAADFVAAAREIGVNTTTARIQFNQARREDAEVESLVGDE